MVGWPAGRLRAAPCLVETIIHDDSDAELVVITGDKPASSSSRTLPRAAPAQACDLRAKASALLAEALGGPEHAALAGAIRDAFFAAAPPDAAGGGADATSRLRSLIAALRANVVLRSCVLDGGSARAPVLATQDPRSWASEDVKAQREEWASSAMAEASQRGSSETRACPECGGKAVFESGSSAAYKMAKSYAHYQCVELQCGKVTHMKE
mmetsp:Transcript_99189/g.251906  ORF Transcript_99189/g.251906 Transcript_99189/m.251906 type:complete len:211 (+) Transcript_99189:135-767(+)|eukprot:CAMPEP_0183544304 /NCGR_PEP_ID=MMETSP0371-20130417/47248_1 /TAXON_ID=268820 /ORGANISM="Peridinium aciculiferum, Strain PAER-2" /LENGTH=210 /DNA_ID=CAMNT_0025746045 /DNA_START=75 /DNA_END=707 /DNA_ORIENTATION=-